jgi:hypothetical protein
MVITLYHFGFIYFSNQNGREGKKSEETYTIQATLVLVIIICDYNQAFKSNEYTIKPSTESMNHQNFIQNIGCTLNIQIKVNRFKCLIHQYITQHKINRS